LGQIEAVWLVDNWRFIENNENYVLIKGLLKMTAEQFSVCHLTLFTYHT